MGKGINKAFITGYVGADPETRRFGERDLTSFRVATSTGGFTGRDGVEVPERTQWHNIKVWGPQAAIASQYIHKGDLVTVVGRIEYRETGDAAAGAKTRYTDIMCDELMLPPRRQEYRPSDTGNGTVDGGVTYANTNGVTYAKTPMAPPEPTGGFKPRTDKAYLDKLNKYADDLPF